MDRLPISVYVSPALKLKIRVAAAHAGHSMVKEITDVLVKRYGDEKPETPSQPGPYSS